MTGMTEGNGYSHTAKSQKAAAVSFSYPLWAKFFE
jgi:hypothetical protein